MNQSDLSFPWLETIVEYIAGLSTRNQKTMTTQDVKHNLGSLIRDVPETFDLTATNRLLFSQLVWAHLYDDDIGIYAYALSETIDQYMTPEISETQKSLLSWIKMAINLINASTTNEGIRQNLTQMLHQYPRHPLVLLYLSLYQYHKSDYKQALEFADLYIKEHYTGKREDPILDLKIKLDLKYASYLVGKDPEKAKEHLDTVELFRSKTGQYEYINQIESQQRRISEYIKIQERFDDKMKIFEEKLEQERSNQIQLIGLFASILGFAVISSSLGIETTKGTIQLSSSLIVMFGMMLGLVTFLASIRVLFGDGKIRKIGILFLGIVTLIRLAVFIQMGIIGW